MVDFIGGGCNCKRKGITCHHTFEMAGKHAKPKKKGKKRQKKNRQQIVVK